MRYLGIDYGSKKTGLAFSDESGALAFPHSVIPTTRTLANDIVSLLKEGDVTNVVIGHSQAFDGVDNPIMEGVYALQRTLEAKGCAVYLEPEFLTTHQAKRNTADSMADAAAAALILQSFLDRQNG